MDERRPPNPYRPDPPLFPPVVFDDDPDDDPRFRPRRRRDETPEPPARYERRAPVLAGDDDPPRRGGDDWGWDDDEFDDFGRGRGDRGGRGGRDGRRGGGGYPSDRGLVRLVALLAVLGVVVAALVLPGSPVRILGGGSATPADGITASARDSMPTLPNGFTALSKIYDIRVPAGAQGPWSIEVTLNEATTDAGNIGMYAYDGARWTRIANVALAPNGASVAGDVSSPPGALAVLRRTGQAKTLGLIVQAGERPDPRAVEATSIIAVMGATLGTDGALQATSGALQAVAPAAGKAKVYLGVTDGADTQGLVRALSSATLQGAHAEAIATAAKGQNAGGVYLDYRNLPGAQKDAFSAFAKTLRERLQRDQLGLVIGIPASAGANGAYDWNALAAVADGVWVRGITDPAVYHDQMEQLLTARRAGNTDLGKVSLVLDRRSADRRGQQVTPLSLREALTAASTIAAPAGGAAPGATVALRAQHLGEGAAAALRWDATARAVAFSYTAPDGAHQVWIENRFSAAFRMDLASRFGLGGIVVDQARQDETLADIWQTAVLFAQDGSVKLERPYGPYLTPCWVPAQGSIEGLPKCWSGDTAPASVTWRAPQQAGTYSVRLVVSDGATFVAQDVALRVGATGTPTPTPTSTATPTPTPTPRPGASTPTPAATATPAATSTPAATATPAATPQATATPPPSSTPPPIQTSTPVPTSTPAPAPTPITPFPGGVPPGPAGE